MNWKYIKGELANVSSALFATEPRMKSEEDDEKEAEPQSVVDKEVAEEE